MATVTIGGMTLGTSGNLTGAAKLEMEDSAGASVYYTAATLRTRMFAGGTGFTAADPLVCGTLNASGTATLAAVTATGQITFSNKVYFDGAFGAYIDSTVTGAHGGSVRIYADNGAASVLAATFSASGVSVPSTKALYLDGGSDTYISETVANRMAFFAGGVERGFFDDSVVAGDTALAVWDVTGGARVRVSRGAADSGGAGFRVLRIPN